MQLARFIRSLALPLLVLPLSAALPAGCSDEGPPTEEAGIRNVKITADDIDALAPGENLDVDLVAADVLYHFDYRKALDFTRIRLTSGGQDGAPMDAAMGSTFARPYSPLAATDERFILTGNPENFTELGAVDIAELRNKGILMKERGADGAAVQPQSVGTGDCVHQVTYYYVEVEIGGVIHGVWCLSVVRVCDGEVACSELMFHGNHEYLFCDNQATWANAEAYCTKFQMKLVTLNDAAEEAWVYERASSISTQKWWMGLNDRAAEGTFVWQSGDALSYQNWYPGEPNNLGDEDCGQINRYHPHHGWNDEPCSFHLRYICESY